MKTIEGTWEEIKSMDAQLTGRRLRVVIESEYENLSGRKGGATRAQAPRVEGPSSLAELISAGAFVNRKQIDIPMPA